MPSQLDIFNFALHHVGSSARVMSVDEQSPEAELCRLWWDQVVRAVHEGAYWPHATAIEKLVQLAPPSSDPRGFSYRYALPADCIRPRHLISFMRFVLGRDPSAGRYLATNDDEAELIYTVLVSNPAEWPAEQIDATALLLASRIATPLTGRRDLAMALGQEAAMMLMTASAHAMLSEQNPWKLTGRRSRMTEHYIYPTAEVVAQSALG